MNIHIHLNPHYVHVPFHQVSPKCHTGQGPIYLVKTWYQTKMRHLHVWYILQVKYIKGSLR